MPRTMLNDQHWSKLKPILLDLNIYDKPNLRNIMEGILYRLRTGCPWRDIPECFGCHNTIFKSFRRWAKSNKLMTLFKKLIKEPDLEWLFMDASYVRSHQHSSGAQGGADQAISQSVGGNSSKIHLIVDAHGYPVEFMISNGTTSDVKVAPDLLNLVDLSHTDCVIADKGYDSEDLRLLIERKNKGHTTANIPRRKNSKRGNLEIDWYLYKIRHLVENTFATLKHYRGIATRFDKLKQSFENNLALACAYLWLKL